MASAIAKASPELTSRKGKNPFASGRAWETAWDALDGRDKCAKRKHYVPEFSVVPIPDISTYREAETWYRETTEGGGCSVSFSPDCGARRWAQWCKALDVLELHKAFVRKRGLFPGCYELSLREQAKVLGIGVRAMREHILLAVEFGLLAVLDPGEPGKGGTYTNQKGGGLKALYCHTYGGKTLEEVIAEAEGRPLTRKRRAFRAHRPDEPVRVVDTETGEVLQPNAKTDAPCDPPDTSPPTSVQPPGRPSRVALQRSPLPHHCPAHEYDTHVDGKVNTEDLDDIFGPPGPRQAWRDEPPTQSALNLGGALHHATMPTYPDERRRRHRRKRAVEGQPVRTATVHACEQHDAALCSRM